MGTTVYDASMVALPRRERFADKVEVNIWLDQHGRSWDGTIDKKTLHPVGPLMPGDWRAPHPLLVAPSKYHTFPKKRGLSAFVINYEQWIVDYSAVWREWTDVLARYARAEFGQMAASALENPPPHLLELCGPTPMHLDFIHAMRSGNRWALGIPSPVTGLLYDKPQWAAEAWGSLARHETFDGSSAVLNVDTSKFANPDDQPTEADGEDSDDDDVEEIGVNKMGRRYYKSTGHLLPVED